MNHFNHYELTRKDLLVKNVKRYRKDLEREAIRAGRTPRWRRNASSAVIPPGDVPLPGEYALFADAFRKETEASLPTAKDDEDAESAARPRATSGRGVASRNASRDLSARRGRRKHPTWIMKPTGKAQGKGIFLINSLQQTKRWANASYAGGAHNGLGRAGARGEEAYVVSRYVDDPLLIGGKKFDLRLYVVVTSFRPLRAFVSRLGFARFCAAKYVSSQSARGDLDDHCAHLTNVAVQKKNAEYNEKHGGKWSLTNLRLFLERRAAPRRRRACSKSWTP